MCLIVKALKYQRPENPNMDKAAIRRLVTVPASSLDTALPRLGAAVRATVGRTARRTACRNGSANLSSALALLSSTRLLARPCARSLWITRLPRSPEDQERGRSIDQEEQPEPERSEDPPVATDTCDGEELRDPRVPRLRLRPAAPGDRQEQAPRAVARRSARTGRSTPLLAEYAGHVCAACQAGLGEYERPQLDGLCEQALVASLEGLKGARRRGRGDAQPPHRYGLAELVGDRTFEELRRAKRDKRRRGAHRRRSATACRPGSHSLRALRRAANQRQSRPKTRRAPAPS